MQWGDIIARTTQSAEWRLVGEISKWADITPVKFNDDLNRLESRYKHLTIKLHSGGGSIYDGLQMYHRLKSSKATIKIDVEGIAASMGSALLMAGSYRRISRYGRLMIHQGAGGVKGSASQIITYGEELRKNNDQLAEIYAEAIKWKHPERDKAWIMANWMVEGQNTWFSAYEALEAGLVHEVFEGGLTAAPSASFSFDEMVAFYDRTLTNNTLSIDMETEEILAKYGLNAQSSNDDIVRKLRELDQRIEDGKNDDIYDQIQACVQNGSITVIQAGHFTELVADGKGDTVASIMEGYAHVDPSIELKPRKKKTDASKLDEKTASLDDFRREAPDRLKDDPELYERLYKKEFGEDLND